MIYVSKVMADVVLKAFEDITIVDKTQQEFNNSMKDREYKCSIPTDVKVLGLQ